MTADTLGWILACVAMPLFAVALIVYFVAQKHGETP